MNLTPIRVCSNIGYVFLRMNEESIFIVKPRTLDEWWGFVVSRPGPPLRRWWRTPMSANSRPLFDYQYADTLFPLTDRRASPRTRTVYFTVKVDRDGGVGEQLAGR